MPIQHRIATALSFGLVLVVATGGPASAQDPPAPPPGVDVQARGPVHEAFAQPSSPQPTQGPLVPKQPPDPVQELPPDQKPDGDNVQWIPGDRAWDDETNDFLWVSGCWRVPPPGMRWVPGHWQEVQGGWLRVSGFWTPDNTTQMNYIPPPPPSREQGPSSDAPTGDSNYVPGSWVYENTGYLWRPGFWIPYRPGWVWIPGYYVWTPSGCLFIDGYWDHAFDQRGFLFSPVRFDMGLWRGYGQPYVPQYMVQPDFLMVNFARPQCHAFYFGDYYDPRYERQGFVAWPDYHPTPRAYDPNFGYYRSQHRGDQKWEPALRQLYSGRRGGEIPRPPRTLALQTATLRTLAANQTETAMIHRNVSLTHNQNATVIAPFSRVNAVRVTNLNGISGEKGFESRELRTQNVTREEREREVKSVAQMGAVSTQRREVENRMLLSGEIPVKHTDPARPVRFEYPRPIPYVTERPIQKAVPSRIEPPAHEVRPIPKYEPARPPEPRRERR